ncbi:MAG: site-specific DNA-methyltransferase [Nanoarchaeota archaeon]|nr:site-specific DNA-methyltransferase [Nanoarchaeota archaeon]
MQKRLSLKEASEWASDFLGRDVTPSNITYLIQYAKIKKFMEQLIIKVEVNELKNYYSEQLEKQNKWKNKLGKDLDWGLSFDELKESDTTKHVHRLHPYKGKFIPQLVEYFLDEHINTHKKEIYFNQGDIVLDPFMGSGTTLIQSSEIGLHSLGIDVSEFNCLIAKSKLGNYEVSKLNSIAKDILFKTLEFSKKTFDDSFDEELKSKLNEFNKKNFPIFEFRRKVVQGKINEMEFGEEKLEEFLRTNKGFFEKNGTKDKSCLWSEKEMNSFLNKWFSKRVRQELFYCLKLIEEIEDENIKNIMKIILSRTARSCRATSHSDLATLREPQIGPYYCRKHKKLCTPINSISKHLTRYTYDTIKRIKEFSELKKKVYSEVLHGDSRELNIFKEVKKQNPKFYNLLKDKKIDGVFTSPPYVGQIDYHEQHAYSYDLLGIKRKDENEIGPLFKGKGKQAQEEYIEGVSNVLKNVGKFVKDNGNFFIVANDTYNLYPEIARRSGLKIIEKFKRPVLNRTERDRQPYCEMIFRMKKEK